MIFGKTDYECCAKCKHTSLSDLDEPCFSCLNAEYGFPNFVKEEKNMSTLSNVEKGKLEEIGRAMSPEEMDVIIKTVPSEIIIKEIGRRFGKLEELKKEINAIYGHMTTALSDAKTIDTTLADFSRR